MNQITKQSFIETIRRPTLYKYEYDSISQIKKENPKRSFSELHELICSKNWRLYRFSADQINNMFHDFRDHNWFGCLSGPQN